MAKTLYEIVFIFAGDTVHRKANQLVAYENKNKAETLLSILAKLNCDKSINLIQSRSFEMREYL